LTVELKPAPETPAANITELEGRHPLAGTVIGNVSPALADQYNIDPFSDGVVILRIRRGGIANQLDFRPGDFVRAINGEKVMTVDALKKLVDKKVGEEWHISVERAGKTFDFVFRG
jgi:C-terminal processing protease CtpA/Prc